MTFHDAVEALSQCIRYSAELVETTRLNCRLVVQSRQYNTFRKCKDFAKRIDKCRDRLLSSKQEVEELPDEYSNLICLTSPLHFNPFIWRGIPWSPVASAVEYIAEDLINDSLEFEAWNDPDEDIDEAHRLETCEWLLEKWPEDLHQRLLILRSHFEHEAGQIPIDISTQSTTALPGYLGLVVDKTNRRVRRLGYESTADIQFTMMPESSDRAESPDWYTFQVAFDAGVDGATRERWMSGYPSDPDGRGPSQSKQRVKKAIQKLGLTLKNGSGLKIVEWDGGS